MKSRIMYNERKAEAVTGEGRIGRVIFSKTLRSMYYNGMTFLKVKGGYKYNCIELESGEPYWISGCKKDGDDRMYNSGRMVSIDEDVREEYWIEIRRKPDLKNYNTAN